MRAQDPRTGDFWFQKRRRSEDGERGPHELTFSWYKRFRFLGKDRVRHWFVEELDRARLKYAVDLWAWVIMAEHVHLLVAPRENGSVMGQFRGAIKEQVARRAITWLEEHAPHWIPKITVVERKVTRRRFWQPGGGYDRKVTTTKTLQAMIDYLHNNPVRRGLVVRPEEWEWSSARWYAGVQPVLLQVDRTLPMMPE